MKCECCQELEARVAVLEADRERLLASGRRFGLLNRRQHAKRIAMGEKGVIAAMARDLEGFRALSDEVDAMSDEEVAAALESGE